MHAHNDRVQRRVRHTEASGGKGREKERRGVGRASSCAPRHVLDPEPRP